MKRSTPRCRALATNPNAPGAPGDDVGAGAPPTSRRPRRRRHRPREVKLNRRAIKVTAGNPIASRDRPSDKAVRRRGTATIAAGGGRPCRTPGAAPAAMRKRRPGWSRPGRRILPPHRTRRGRSRRRLDSVRNDAKATPGVAGGLAGRATETADPASKGNGPTIRRRARQPRLRRRPPRAAACG